MAALMPACATRQPVVAGPGQQAYSGRMSVRIAAGGSQGERAVTLVFDLRGQPQVGTVEFSTPLGTIVAQARWSPSEVVLTTPQGEQAFADLDSLSRKTLGEVLPLAALFDWLQGRPSPAAPSRAEAGGRAFSQLGWRVDVSELSQARLSAQRAQAPAVQVRVLLDRSPA